MRGAMRETGRSTYRRGAMNGARSSGTPARRARSRPNTLDMRVIGVAPLRARGGYGSGGVAGRRSGNPAVHLRRGRARQDAPLHAVGQYVEEQDPTSVIRCVTCETSAQRLHQLSEGQRATRLSEMLLPRENDVLLYRRYSVLEGKIETQEVPFHTFNAFYEENKVRSS